ncbi:hypothetical protein [Kitasatospora sp. NPDC088346]|uniref:hypothetical protein n=1 Tax=Kitasatospora sp. NPDC088346 TaxID=3364073 RepID=UPI003824FD0A
MTDQENTPPAVWDPTARGGAGGWVRRKAGPAAAAPGAPDPARPPYPAPPQPPQQAAQGFPPAAFPPAGAPFDGAPFAGAPFDGDQQPTTLLPPVPAGPDGPPLFRSPAPPSGPPAGPHAGPHPGTQAGPHAGPPPGFPAQTGQPFPPHAGGFPGTGPAAPGPFPAFGHPDQPGPPPYPPPAGDYPGPEEDAPRRRRTPMAVALGVALLLTIGIGVTWAVRNTGTDSADGSGATPAGSAAQQPPPQSGAPSAPAAGTPSAGSPSASNPAGAGSAGPNAAAQAKGLDALLAQAENARSGIGSSVAKVRSCPARADVDSAVAVFDSGAQQRDQLIAALAKLELGDVPGGADLARTLSTAWQQSGDIDRAYAAWGRTVSGQGCVNGTAPSTADYKRAGELNPQATQSKNDFATRWKPIAEAYGLTPRTADRI